MTRFLSQLPHTALLVVGLRLLLPQFQLLLPQFQVIYPEFLVKMALSGKHVSQWYF
jgi:hypothetical protein